jgi:hypothetical protein
MDIFLWMEATSFGTWLRESPSLAGLPTILFLHTLGMAIVAGGATMIDFALLGLWPRTSPIKPLERLYPLLWAGFAVNAVTGAAMFMKNANTYGRTPDFWLKLLFVAGGVGVLAIMRRRVFADPRLDSGPATGRARMLAWGSLLCWFGAIVAGRLIAYLGPALEL